MRDKLREQLKELIGPGAKGIVAFAALPGEGLTWTWQAALKSTDRLLRDFVSIEEVSRREPDVENVDVTKFDRKEGGSVEKSIPASILRQPEVICIPEVASGDAISLLCDWIENEDKLSLLSLRGKDSADALLRLMALKPGEKFPKYIKAIISERLIRKLCETCREAIQPTPEQLQRLGIPAGRVQVLYREKQPLPPGQEPPKKKKGEPEICPNCRGLGYRGRTAIYEFLVVDDKIREALVKQPKLEVIKQLARAAGNRSMQEEGILLVAMGTTSVAELQRVLKQ
jgi:type II secretory ATPase GspE/PulE/Tfp pilus assembly ATPase PilB-like protein